MALQDIVKSTERFGENTLLVEFENGLAVGYEKNDRGVAYGIIKRKNMPFEAAYNNSKCFLKSDPLVQSQLVALVEEEESFGRKAENFKKEVSLEAHWELLKHLSFVK